MKRLIWLFLVLAALILLFFCIWLGAAQTEMPETGVSEPAQTPATISEQELSVPSPDPALLPEPTPTPSPTQGVLPEIRTDAGQSSPYEQGFVPVQTTTPEPTPTADASAGAAQDEPASSGSSVSSGSSDLPDVPA